MGSSKVSLADRNKSLDGVARRVGPGWTGWTGQIGKALGIGLDRLDRATPTGPGWTGLHQLDRLDRDRAAMIPVSNGTAASVLPAQISKQHNFQMPATTVNRDLTPPLDHIV